MNWAGNRSGCMGPSMACGCASGSIGVLSTNKINPQWILLKETFRQRHLCKLHPHVRPIPMPGGWLWPLHRLTESPSHRVTTTTTTTTVTPHFGPLPPSRLQTMCMRVAWQHGHGLGHGYRHGYGHTWTRTREWALARLDMGMGVGMGMGIRAGQRVSSLPEPSYGPTHWDCLQYALGGNRC